MEGRNLHKPVESPQFEDKVNQGHVDYSLHGAFLKDFQRAVAQRKEAHLRCVGTFEVLFISYLANSMAEYDNKADFIWFRSTVIRLAFLEDPLPLSTA